MKGKFFGIIAGPFFFLGGTYVLFRWTHRLQEYLLVEWGDLIGLDLDEVQVKELQRKIRPWLLRIHIIGMFLAFLFSLLHSFSLYQEEGFMEGGFSHIIVWVALIILLLYVLTGLDLKFRLLPNQIRRKIRIIHKNPFLVFFIAGLILTHVLLID